MTAQAGGAALLPRCRIDAIATHLRRASCAAAAPRRRRRTSARARRAQFARILRRARSVCDPGGASPSTSRTAAKPTSPRVIATARGGAAARCTCPSITDYRARRMEFVRFDADRALRRESLRHPRTASRAPRRALRSRDLDLVFMPLVAFDRARLAAGQRRRLLRSPPAAPARGRALAPTEADRRRLRVPARRRSSRPQRWDVPLDAVLTETRLYTRLAMHTDRRIAMNYWLMKSEPDTFGIDHLARSEASSTSGWDGVRNFQARNFLREMKKGDLAFFYHSSCDDPGHRRHRRRSCARRIRIRTAFDPKNDHYDAGQRSGQAALVHGRREAREEVRPGRSRSTSCARMRPAS